MRIEVACYERVGDRWQRYEQGNQTNSFRFQNEHSIDIKQCHHIDGKVEGEKLYTHMKFNMNNIPAERTKVKPDAVEIDEITPDPKGTKIYSDGSARVEEKIGACAAIVNTADNDQAKNSYRKELEGLYLGTRLAEGAVIEDKQWECWCDSRAAITQCEN